MNSRFRAACVCVLALIAGLVTSVLDLTGRMAHQDRNHDGVADVWSYYDSRGELNAVLRDTNFDGYIDAREAFSDNLLIARELDQNFDNRFDLVEEFGGNGQARVLVDTDDDGTADLLVLTGNDGRTVMLSRAGEHVDHLHPNPLHGGSQTRPLFDPFSQVPSLSTAARPDADLTFTISTQPHFLPQSVLIDDDRIEDRRAVTAMAPAIGSIDRLATSRAPPSSFAL